MDDMGNVQIFGLKNSAPTRAAERFFKERRIPIQFVDLKQRPMAPAELRRFLERFGADGLLDRQGKAYQDAGLAYLRPQGQTRQGDSRSRPGAIDADLVGRIERDPRLLRLPLVRSGNQLSAGPDEESWKRMAEEG